MFGPTIFRSWSQPEGNFIKAIADFVEAVRIETGGIQEDCLYRRIAQIFCPIFSHEEDEASQQIYEEIMILGRVADKIGTKGVEIDAGQEREAVAFTDVSFV